MRTYLLLGFTLNLLLLGGCSGGGDELDALSARVDTLEQRLDDLGTTPEVQVPIVLAAYRSDDPLYIVPDGTLARSSLCIEYNVTGVERTLCRDEWAPVAGYEPQTPEHVEFIESGQRLRECWDSAEVGKSVPECWW